MNIYLKPFFIIYFLLFTFISNSLAQETASSETVSVLNTGESDVCFDFVIDIHLLDHPIRNIFDSEDVVLEGYQIDIENRTRLERLELAFSVRRPGSLGILHVIGIGESIFFSRDIPGMVQSAVRDGYGQLRDLLRFEFRRPRSDVSVVRYNRARVPLDRSHHIQEGDIFYIFPRVDYYNACSDVSDSPPSALAISRVVEIDDTASILEMVMPDGGRSVQVGDIVRLSPEIDFESRLQANTGFRTRGVLQFNVPGIYVVRDTGSSKTWTKLTRFIERFLTTEAPNFGFHAVISR